MKVEVAGGSRSGRALAAIALALLAAIVVAAPGLAAKPSQTVKITSPQDVDRVRVLQACHVKGCTLIVGGVVKVGSKSYGFKRVSRSVIVHVTNQVYLRLKKSSKSAVKRALRKGRTVTARITVIARDRAGNSNKLGRTIRLRS